MILRNLNQEKGSQHIHVGCHHVAQHHPTPYGTHCLRHATFHALKDVGQLSIQLSPFTVRCPCIQPYKENGKGCRFRSDQDMKATVTEWVQQQLRAFCEGDAQVGSIRCQPEHQKELFLTTSTPFTWTIPEQVSFGKAYQINVSAKVSLSCGDRQTQNSKRSWQPHSAQWLLLLSIGSRLIFQKYGPYRRGWKPPTARKQIQFLCV
jgi:hypothetical protein